MALPFQLNEVNFCTLSGSRERGSCAYRCLTYSAFAGHDQDPRCPDDVFDIHYW